MVLPARLRIFSVTLFHSQTSYCAEAGRAAFCGTPAAHLPNGNRFGGGVAVRQQGGDESRGGMRETAGKERATTIAARSWRRSPRISSPLSFLRRLPTSPLSKPHLLQATGDRAGRTNRHMGNAGPHTGERAAVEAPRGRIERAFVLMPIRGYSPHRLPQGQARQAAPWASDQIFRRLQTNLRIVLATPENLQQNFLRYCGL